MEKSTFIKRFVALFLVVLMSINTFAAVVGDNDGAAFITKGEFDSMKNNFQSQLDRYNSSIDNKIDGAIASYLAGLSIATDHILLLDSNCHYKFPLVMFSGNDLWNDYGNTFYYNVSVPSYARYETQLKADNNNGTNRWINDDNRNQPLHMAENDTNIDADKWVRAGLWNITEEYDGRMGYLNLLSRDSSVSRLINGTERTCFRLDEEGIGQFFNLYVVQPNEMTRYSDNSGNQGNWYNYINFLGFNTTQLTFNSDSTISYTGTTTNSRSWTHDQLLGWAANRNLHHFDYLPLTGATTLAELLSTQNSYVASWGVVHRWERAYAILLLSDRRFVLTDWQETGVRSALFAKSCNMPGNIKGKWNLIPYLTSANNLPVTVWMQPNSPTWTVAWNFTGGPKDVYFYGGTSFQIMPKWISQVNTGFAEQTGDDFSKLRASLVYYTDSNGQRHFMDEGMYIGKYDHEGTVRFTLKFKSTSNTNVRFALSKQPFGFDSVDSNRIRFKCNTDTISAGNYATVSPNQDVKVSVEDIVQNDELYLMWWPVSAANDCQLEKFSDYLINY